MNEKTFAELYCERHGLAPEAYDKAVLNETLYPHARFLAPFVKLLWPRHFAADLEFVISVGMLRRYREFFNETEEFTHHPENHGFFRVTLNVRVSSRRLRRLVRMTLHGDSPLAHEVEEHSAVPFGGVGVPKPTLGSSESHKSA